MDGAWVSKSSVGETHLPLRTSVLSTSCECSYKEMRNRFLLCLVCYVLLGQFVIALIITLTSTLLFSPLHFPRFFLLEHIYLHSDMTKHLPS